MAMITQHPYEARLPKSRGQIDQEMVGQKRGWW